MLQCIRNVKLRKLLFCVVLVTITLNLFGCGIKKKEKLNYKEAAGEISEIYTMTQMTVENKEEPVSISKAAIGGIYVVTGDGTVGKTVWHVDKNDKWEKKYDLTDILGINENSYCEAFITSEGEVFAEYNNEVNVTSDNPFIEGNIEYVLFDAEGKKHEVSLDLPNLKPDAYNPDEEENQDKINHIHFAKYIDGYIYAVDSNSNIFEINLTDYTSKMVFENTDFEYIDDFYVYDRTLIIWSGDNICYEGIDTHDNEEDMYNRFKSYFENAKRMNIPVGMDIEEGNLWTLSADRIYTLDLENDGITEIKVVGTNQNESVSMQVTVGGVLYALVYNIEIGEYRLNKYSDVDDIATLSNADSRCMKIWALDSSQGFEDTVRCFTDKYPNVSVDIEIGMGEYDSGITTMDALKNLNTALLSGEGPDVIYFEGVNPEKYIESNQLYDMTELISELKNSGDYFNNLLDAFSKDGRIYVVPNGVTILSKLGVPEAVENSRDMQSFAEYIENNNSEHSITNEYQTGHYIVNEYYKTIKEELISGTIEREKLKDFFELAEKIYSIEGIYGIYGKSEPYISLFAMMDPSLCATMYDETFDFVLLNIQSPLGCVYSSVDMVEKINGVMEIPANDYKYNYVPRGCIAIAANSANLDLALEYVKTALGEECQSRTMGAIGLRVNKKGFINSSEDYYHLFSNGEEDESEKALYDKVVADIMNALENVNSPFIIDNVFDQIVMDELIVYISGTKDIDTVIDGMLEKINMYLSE